MGGADAFVPYPDIRRLGAIGDRRTAAMVAADGTIGWLCLPDFDAPPVLGALLDAERGGFWRLGPVPLAPGKQRYLDATMVLLTRWIGAEGTLELRDAMAWPEDERPSELEPRRVVIRQLHCTAGSFECAMDLVPRCNFTPTALARDAPGGASFALDGYHLGLWSSVPTSERAGGVGARFRLRAGERAWFVLTLDESPRQWNAGRAARALEAATGYWRQFAGSLRLPSELDERARSALTRSALVLHFGQFAPSGAYVAAPTASLPERQGGDLNWDYRFSWIRDGSLAAAALTRLGHSAERYLDWVAGLGSLADTPLQVVYRASGDPHLDEVQRHDLAGYRHSLPVRFGNRAVGQFQLGSPGYLADALWTHLCAGGGWKSAYGELLRRLAADTLARWRDDDAGIWELPTRAPYLVGKLMAWVLLDRACRIATRVGDERSLAELPRWRAAMEELRESLLAHGWSEARQSFAQRYDADGLDASALLVPLMGFLPPEDSRVRSTVAAIEAALAPDGLVHRFDPRETPGLPDVAPEAFEGSFVVCSFWLATCQALAGRREAALAIIERCLQAAGPLGLFSEELDVGASNALGNTPLLFAHAAHIRATLALARQASSSRTSEAG